MSRMTNLLDLFTRFVDEERGDFDRVAHRLALEGFTPFEINAALEWHTGPENVRHLETARGDSFEPRVRVFTPAEAALLAPEAKGYILEETFARRIDFAKVEEVIDRLRLLEVEHVDRDDLKAMLALDNPDPEVLAGMRIRFASLH